MTVVCTAVGQAAAFFNHRNLPGAYELIRYQLMALAFRSPIANAVESHQVLVDAVAKGDVAAACASLPEHIFENVPRHRLACA